MKPISALLAVLLALCCTALAGPAASAGPVRSAPAALPNGLTKLNSCVQQRRRLDVLFLMDVSQSLNETDQQNLRVPAAQLAVDGMRRLVDPTITARTVNVQVQIAGFAKTFQPQPSWLNLATSAATINNELESYKTQVNGPATDYLLALSQSQAMLANEAAAATTAGGSPPCEALIWFTDGNYQPDGDRSTQAEIANGTGQLCDTGGVVDQLRADGVTVISVALTQELNNPQQDFLRGIAADGGTPCGGPAAAPGVYVPADQPNQLEDIFSQLPEPTPGGELCAVAGGACSFTLDPVLRSFYVVIHTGVPTSQVELVPPDGTPETLSPPGASNPVQVAGANLRWAWFDQSTLAVTGALPPDSVADWHGLWQVTVAGTGRPASGRVYLIGNVAPQIVGTPVFQRDKQWTFDVDTTEGGSSAARTELGQLKPNIAVTLADGDDVRPATVTPIAGQPGSAEVHFSPPASWRSSVVTATVTLGVRTSAGVDISPPPLTQQVQVRTPLTLAPAQLLLPSVTGKGDTTGELTVSAAATGGCVWIPANGFGWLTSLPVPVTATTTLSADSAAHCLPVTAGQHRDVEVQFTVRRGWTGTVHGDIPVLQSIGGGRPIQVDVPVSFTLIPNPNQTELWLLIGLLALLTLSPLLVVLAFNHLLVARFRRPAALRVSHVDYEITGNGPRRKRGTGDLHWLGHPMTRRLSEGEVTLRTRCSWWNPFDTPRVRAKARGRLLVSNRDRSPTPSSTVDGLSLDLAGTVLVSRPAGEVRDEFTVEVVLIVDSNQEPTDTEIQDAVEAAADRLRPTADAATNADQS